MIRRGLKNPNELDWEDPATAARFKRDWIAGKHVKVIAREFGISPQHVKNYVRPRLGLEPRKQPGVYRFGSVTVHGLPKHAIEKAKAQAAAKGISLSRYLASLILKDAGFGS